MIKAITDDQGKYRGGDSEYGAEVGTHVILAIDVREFPFPFHRESSENTQSLRNLMFFEVKSGADRGHHI